MSHNVMLKYTYTLPDVQIKINTSNVQINIPDPYGFFLPSFGILAASSRCICHFFMVKTFEILSSSL